MLAIVIPYFNIRFFKETLESLANQTNKNFKVYVFNDNSPEDPEELLNDFINKFDFEYHKFNDNFGGQSLVKHWHRCLTIVTEDWFSILGDDDCLPNNYIASFYDNLATVTTQNINLIRFASEHINDNNIVASPTYLHPIIENSIASLVRKLNGNTRSSLSEFIYKNVPQANKYFIEFPNAYYSDDLSLLIATNFQNIFTINEAIVQIRRGNFNLSGINSNAEKANLSEFLFFKYLLNNYNDKFDLSQKKLFLHKLNRVVIRTKSLEILWFVLKNQLIIKDYAGTLYFPKLVFKKLLCKIRYPK